MHTGTASKKPRSVPKGVRAPERTWELMEAATKVRGLPTTNDGCVEAFELFIAKYLPNVRKAA